MNLQIFGYFTEFDVDYGQWRNNGVGRVGKVQGAPESLVTPLTMDGIEQCSNMVIT